MEILGQLVALLVLASLVLADGSESGSDPQQPAISAEQLKAEIADLQQKSANYADRVREYASNLKENYNSDTKDALRERSRQNFEDGYGLYEEIIGYVEHAIGNLWFEIRKHAHGVNDGFATGYRKCSELSSFAQEKNWNPSNLSPGDYNRARSMAADDWWCLAYEFEGIFKLCDKLTRHNLDRGLTIEEAIKGLGQIFLGLAELDNSAIYFYYAVEFFDPNPVPDFSGGQSSGTESERELLVRSLEELLQIRNGPPGPPGGPPPNGSPPPPPPSTTTQTPGGGKRLLEKALMQMLRIRNGQPGPPGPPGSQGQGPPPNGTPPPPPPSTTTQTPGGGKRLLEKALMQMLRIRNGQPGPPGPPGSQGQGPPPNGTPPPPPPSTTTQTPGGGKRLLEKALMQMLRIRNGQPGPPGPPGSQGQGPPPNGNPPPPPPSTTTQTPGGGKRLLEKALMQMLRIRNGQPGPPGPPGSQGQGPPPNGTPPPPPPSTTTQTPGGGKRLLEKALMQMLRIRNGQPGPPGPPGSQGQGPPPNGNPPPPPPSTTTQTPGRRGLSENLKTMLRKLHLYK